MNPMKGFIPVEIPVKRYVKAYIESNLGVPLKLDRQTRSLITEKLIDYLDKSNPGPLDAPPVNYNSTIKVYLTQDQFARRGASLTSANIRSFNSFCEILIKEKFRLLMDDSWSVMPGFDCHIPTIRKALGIGIDDWADDSMKKDYYRYRQKKGLLILKRGQIHVGRRPAAIHAPF